ncbi:MAG: hypothetical protein ABIJ61_11860 [bacterium]
MRRALEEIRGVVGVAGVIIWDKVSNECHHLLPARLGDEEAERICLQLADLSRLERVADHLATKYKKGWLLLFNERDAATLIMARPDLNRATLNLVVKAVLRSIAVRAAKQKAAHQEAKWRPQHGDTLVRTINLSLAWFQGKMPRFTTAQLLHQIKEELAGDYPVVKYLTVDANGGVFVKHEARSRVDGTLLPASVRLLQRFLDLATVREAAHRFDLRIQTAEVEKELTQLGFYDLFEKQPAAEQA